MSPETHTPPVYPDDELDSILDQLQTVLDHRQLQSLLARLNALEQRNRLDVNVLLSKVPTLFYLGCCQTVVYYIDNVLSHHIITDEKAEALMDIKAMALQQEGRYEEVLATYDPNDVLAMSKCWCYRDMHLFDKCLESAEEAIRKDPSQTWAYFQRGWVRRQQGDMVSASEDFFTVIDRRGIDPIADFYMPFCYAYMDMYDKAFRAVEASAGSRGNSFVAAEIYSLAGDLDRAERHLDECLNEWFDVGLNTIDDPALQPLLKARPDTVQRIKKCSAQIHDYDISQLAIARRLHEPSLAITPFTIDLYSPDHPLGGQIRLTVDDLQLEFCIGGGGFTIIHSDQLPNLPTGPIVQVYLLEYGLLQGFYSQFDITLGKTVLRNEPVFVVTQGPNINILGYSTLSKFHVTFEGTQMKLS